MKQWLTVELTDSMENLGKIYRWCCNQWPNKDGWDVIAERINWESGDLTVTYKFIDPSRRLLFYLIWVDTLNN